MRRGPGIAGLQHAALARQQFKQAGDEVKKSNLQAMKEQLATFRKNLEEFARKYKNDIRKDPVFRAQFHAMCANIGVDPLSSSKGMWAELLGLGDFYYELGVQIMEAAWATRAHNGGLMVLPALIKYVTKRRGGSEAISEDDVVRAVKKLKVLGGGFNLVTIGSVTYLRSVPGELNTDKNTALALAQDKGYVSASDFPKKAGWTQTRADSVMQALLKEGLCMVDDGAADGVRLYWFPCLSVQG